MESVAGLTRALARYAAQARFEALPDAVRHEAARAFLNWIAVVIGGAGEDAPAIAAQYVAAQNRRGGASSRLTWLTYRRGYRRALRRKRRSAI